ncbi:GNAT family N-acetyltransferase [Nocardia sp. NBC_01503]|uniref:GNAT family N-acetyltransferase n=1 Tax=Nocardia sp. NBC_01503 TaxID=2975997 RepID=UPI002E7BFD92|nr:GNAT family N-acetyltransferase [Nocardia sp. NBC_01503]WTL32041.1 GNAT family N-acetyltransferase [Nocardia sp. NBC_01503]
MPKTLQNIAVRPATKRDIPAMTAVLDRAFSANDPFGAYMFPNPSQRARSRPRLTRAMIRHLFLPAGGAHVATSDGRVVGVVLWQPSDRRFGLLRDLASIPEFLRAMGFDGPRVLSMYATIAGLAPGLPHYFGVTLGVDPEFQHIGVGKALSLFCLTEVEQAAVPLLCLCEDDSMGFYSAFGSQRLGHIRLGRTGPEVNVMMWLPSSLRARERRL